MCAACLARHDRWCRLYIETITDNRIKNKYLFNKKCLIFGCDGNMSDNNDIMLHIEFQFNIMFHIRVVEISNSMESLLMYLILISFSVPFSWIFLACPKIIHRQRSSSCHGHIWNLQHIQLFRPGAELASCFLIIHGLYGAAFCTN